jgi:hypothetical protein
MNKNQVEPQRVQDNENMIDKSDRLGDFSVDDNVWRRRFRRLHDLLWYHWSFGMSDKYREMAKSMGMTPKQFNDEVLSLYWFPQPKEGQYIE